uniref:Uncharacterized protein n=1 Tax=Cacopsylla melanoneura TaxID=428564 RepID=A0A8D8QSV3_9HEMI
MHVQGRGKKYRVPWLTPLGVHIFDSILSGYQVPTNSFSLSRYILNVGIECRYIVYRYWQFISFFLNRNDEYLKMMGSSRLALFSFFSSSNMYFHSISPPISPLLIPYSSFPDSSLPYFSQLFSTWFLNLVFIMFYSIFESFKASRFIQLV